MAKILLLAVVIWLAFLILRRYLRSIQSDRTPDQQDAAVMVQCRHCGLHIPQNDSIAVNEHYYCSEEHRKQSETDHV